MIIDIYTMRGEVIALEAVRGAIRKLLPECTEPQQEFFKKMYPQGIENMPLDKLYNALDQTQRTIRRNEAVEVCVNRDRDAAATRD